MDKGTTRLFSETIIFLVFSVCEICLARGRKFPDSKMAAIRTKPKRYISLRRKEKVREKNVKKRARREEERKRAIEEEQKQAEREEELKREASECKRKAAEE